MTNETKEVMATKAKDLLAKAERIIWPVAIICVAITAIIAVKEMVTIPPTFVDLPEEYELTSEDYYLTFKVDGETVQGEMTIIAENDEDYIVQMGDKVYVVPKTSVVFE